MAKPKKKQKMTPCVWCSGLGRVLAYIAASAHLLKDARGSPCREMATCPECSGSGEVKRRQDDGDEEETE